MFQVKAVTDFNEVTFHGLECIFVKAHLAKQAAGGMGMGADMGMGMGMGTGMGMGMGAGGSVKGNSLEPAGGMMGGMMGGNGDLNDAQKTVLDAFQRLANGDENGTTLEKVTAELMGTMSKAQVKAAAEALMADGSLYNTCDEEHMAAAFMG